MYAAIKVGSSTRCEEILQQVNPPNILPVHIPNYLAPSILATLFCCLPFGIVAIVFAAQVNAKIQAGDMQGAILSSNKAKMWTWLSFGIGLAATIGYGILYTIILIVAGA